MAVAYGDTMNVALLDFIGPLGGDVLDLGCGVGAWSSELRSRGAERLIGLEPNNDGEAARDRYDEMITSVIEEAELPMVGTVIAADVLEHLVDPWAALRRLRGSLSTGATLYISVPNAQFVKALCSVAAGRFPYDLEGGYWDRTHLRWFTQHSLTQVLQETGWNVERTAFAAGSGWRGRAVHLSGGLLGPWLGHQIHLAATAV